MKPLILILLLALSAEAQGLADAARSERQRQAQVQSTRIITNDDIRVVEPPASQPQAAAATPANPVPAPVTPVTSVDPAQRYREDLEKIRARVRELQDQETALQLQVNQLTNQLFAPVTDQSTRDQAQARLGEVQSRLTLLRGELAQGQRTLADMVAQGPPRE
jgi:hypothetical protein